MDDVAFTLNEPLFTILWIAGIIGIPIILMVIAGYFTVWRGRWKPYGLINLAFMVFVGILTALGGSGDAHGPVPNLQWILFFVFYLPAHLVLAGLVGGGFWYLKRRRLGMAER